MTDAPSGPPGPSRPQSSGPGRDAHPAVRARLDLDRRLATWCGNADDAHPGFGVHDVDLLLLVTHERFEDDLRREAAVAALGTVGTPPAIERLIELSVHPLEHDSVRLQALAGLPQDNVRALAEQLADDPSDIVRDYASRRAAER